MLPTRKILPAPPPIALGYIDIRRIPAGKTPEQVGLPLRACAEEWGYAWGGTYLAQSSHTETLAALTRATAANPQVGLVIVPDTAHYPDGRAVIVTGTRWVCVVTVGAHPHPATPHPEA
jgi:hypothetical protein